MTQRTKKILVWIVSLFIFNSLLFANEAILSIDTGGHTAIIKKNLIVTKSGDIISASNDKTIRVWDSKTGEEKRKILGQIGSGSEGQIFAIALSSDERYLAVGGFINSGNGERIRLYDYQSGKLLSILKSHTNVVLDLAFSPDGKYLASGSADKTVKIWDMGKLESKPKTISFHTNDVYGVKFTEKNTIISASYDKRIALHSLDGKLLNSYTHSENLNYIATNGKEIATCGYGSEIVLFDSKLNQKSKIQSKTVPTGLAYSPNGRYLIAGRGSTPNNVNIYDSHNGYKKIATFDKHRNTTQAVAFLDNQTAVSGGGDNNEIYIWDSKTKEIKTKIVGAGQSVWSVGIAGESVAWGNVDDCSGKNCSKFQKSFNLKSLDTASVTKQSIFNRINSDGLSHSKGGEYGMNDAVLNIEGSSVTITKNGTTGYRHRCYGWYKDSIVSGGSSGHLKIYNSKGVEIASLVGHTGTIWSIALDGERLVSGSSDQTIRVWDLSQLKKGKAKQTLSPLLTLFVGSDNEWVVWTKEGFFNASPNGAKYIGYHINQGPNKEAKYVSVDKLYNTFYRPDLVQKALAGEDISSYTKDIDINTILKAGLAPEVKIKNKTKTSNKRDINLELEVCEYDGGGYDNLTLLLNGMAIEVLEKNRALKLSKQSKTRKECITLEKLISLQNGTNTIGFKATNGAGTIESNLDEIVVNYKGKSSGKPNLHILSIGIDKYRDGDLWLNYSKADAREFTKAIKSVSKPLFKNIYTYSLTDRDVTKSKVLDMFEKVGSKTTREDVFMLYIAGHGITDAKTGAYFYLPVDFRYKNDESVRTDGLSQNDFKLALSKIQAMKSLTILDTCNSGSFAEAMASRGVLQKTAIDKLTRATGRATIVASSKDQVALEGYRGHGVFTYTLMEALKGKGYGSDNKITIKELASYVEDILPDRTYEKWGYEQVPQSNISGNDFPIGVK